MRKALYALALLPAFAAASLAVPAAEDPAVVFKQRFSIQEQIILAGVLTDPAQAEAFAQDSLALPSPELFDKWRVRMTLLAKDYLSKDHLLNDNAKTVSQMIEPAEWATLFISLKFLQNGSTLDAAKALYFHNKIDRANEKLAEGDTSTAHDAVAEGRPRLVKSCQEYLSSPEAVNALTAWGKQKHDEAVRKSRQLAANARNAREQAEAVLKNHKTTATREKTAAKASSGYDGGRGRAGGGTPVYAGNGKLKHHQSGLARSSPSSKSQAPLAVKPPPAPDDGMAELHANARKNAGHLPRNMAIIGGLIGALGFLAGPIVGAAAVAAGALAGYELGKKLFG